MTESTPCQALREYLVSCKCGTQDPNSSGSSILLAKFGACAASGASHRVILAVGFISCTRTLEPWASKFFRPLVLNSGPKDAPEEPASRALSPMPWLAQHRHREVRARRYQVAASEMRWSS